MVEMNMQRRHLQVVVLVLCLVEPPAEVARLVVVDIGQGGDAEAVGFARCLKLWPTGQVACLPSVHVEDPDVRGVHVAGGDERQLIPVR